ncbi:MAG: polymer-forming cytoskeletal protein [Bacteroidales bacterium]|nr:polymer-forming cytoskeletal protein [Bacteroidales bacterium]
MASFQNQQNQQGALYNAITAESKIIGTIVANNDIRIDGTVEGDIQCRGKVVIGEKGLVHGNIQCTNAEVQGRIEGKVEALQTLALRASANIQGDVVTQSLIVEPNAIFCGTCQMGKKNAAIEQK